MFPSSLRLPIHEDKHRKEGDKEIDNSETIYSKESIVVIKIVKTRRTILTIKY